MLKGCKGALGLLKLAKGRDKGEVMSLLIRLVEAEKSGEPAEVFNCSF